MKVTVIVELGIFFKKIKKTASVELEDVFFAAPDPRQEEQNKIEATVKTLLENLK